MTTKIFVGNLSWHTDERTLKNVFASAGPVKFVKVIRDRTTNISKGFAFVTFKEAEAVAVAIDQFHKFVVDGKPIQVTEAEEPKKAGAHKAEAPEQGKSAAAPEQGKSAAAPEPTPSAKAAPEPTPSAKAAPDAPAKAEQDTTA